MCLLNTALLMQGWGLSTWLLEVSLFNKLVRKINTGKHYSSPTLFNQASSRSIELAQTLSHCLNLQLPGEVWG